MTRIYEVAKPQMKLVTTSMVALGISTALTLSVPHEIGHLVDTFQLPPEQAREGMIAISKYLAGIFGIATVANYVRMYSTYIAAQRISTQLRSDLFKNIIKQEVAFFDKTKTGELLNRIGTDVQIVSETLTQTIVNGLRSFIEAIGGIVLLLYLSPKLTIISVFVLPPLGIFSVIAGRRIKKLHKDYLHKLATANDIAEEKLSNIRTVRFFAGENKEIALYKKDIDDSYVYGQKVSLIRSVFYSAVFTLTNVSLIGILYIGGIDILAGNISIGDLTSFLMYSIYVGASFTGLSGVYTDMMKAMGSSERIFELLDKKPEMDLEFGQKLETKDFGIVFRNVAFAYPTRSGVSVLKNLNLEIKPGEVVAIVGGSGSGKSTLVALMNRLYDVSEGEILFNGVNVKDLNSTWLRDKVIGMVPQEPILFNISIEENIGYSQKEIDSEKVEFAAKQANAHNFIMQFPKGYKEHVGAQGVQLSGGQKQRIALARCLIKDPRILVLDEASSALDSESEFLVQEALKNAFHDRTVLIIAHRLSTIKRADRIVVMYNGEIAEMGTHDELIAKEGIYLQLVNRQLNM
jgi:ATP-binding cassette subfamily B (MDR/TAP) protein 10